ncbi:TatD DNase family protein [Nicoletella semolina]|uniref:TatD DNase family protein n=1 Tax=Nicoletella semolina TaxID=271160 RepID=A0A4R2ND05_9PAST|nr:TatD family hydrolase [Nicoletella semolina]MDH2924146.1 deoxyribonuclease [Nicoletella semolina]TCP18958.1 TatD DNase family protein [Nicoletella semolina]
MRFFDTHTHLDFLSQALNCPIGELTKNAQQQGIERLLIVAISAKNFEKVTACAKQFPLQLRYGLGLHPLYIEQHQERDLAILEQLLAQQDPLCTAVAEIGLERAVESLRCNEMWKKQCMFLERQLLLAKRYDLPINLHSRQSHDQLFPFLKKAQLARTGVVHGFAGSYEQAKRFVDLGYKIGVGGTITYQRANKTRETIRKLPLDALLLETDCPDMPVFGFQGQPNRPEYMKVTFQTLCELRTETAEQVAKTIWHTSEQLFWSSL